MRTRDSKKIIYNNETDTKNLFQKYPPLFNLKVTKYKKQKFFLMKNK